MVYQNDEDVSIFLDTKSLLIKSLQFSILLKILDPVELFGEGQYNFQSLKEIIVTDSFMGLDRDARKCQNIETVDECKTRLYVENFRRQCGCLPISLKMSEEVQCSILYQKGLTVYDYRQI